MEEVDRNIFPARMERKWQKVIEGTVCLVLVCAVYLRMYCICTVPVRCKEQDGVCAPCGMRWDIRHPGREPYQRSGRQGLPA